MFIYFFHLKTALYWHRSSTVIVRYRVINYSGKSATSIWMNHQRIFFLCQVDRASQIIWIITNSMHCLSSVYWVITPLHVLGISAAHHQEVGCIYVANGICCTSSLTVNRHSPWKYNKYHCRQNLKCHFLHFYSICLRVGTSGRLLWMWNWTEPLGFMNIRNSSFSKTLLQIHIFKTVFS
jgi:hypothetical protein